MLRQQIYERVANLQAELAALMRLLADFGDIAPVGLRDGPAPTASEPADVRPLSIIELLKPDPIDHPSTNAPSGKKLRWRYLPGTWYRICGPSPFRAGNHANLFQRMLDLYGDKPWPRERLVEAFLTLKSSGQFETIQDDDTALLQFMRIAGPLKGTIEMSAPDLDEEDRRPSSPPAPKAAAKAARPSTTRRRPAAAAEALPPEPGDGAFRLRGASPFRDGSIYALLWGRLEGGSFTREGALAAVEALVGDGAFQTTRKPEVVVRDFLGRLQERGHLDRR
jgi:hypothetical protein